MNTYTLANIAALLEARHTGPDSEFSRVSIDSRTLQAGDVFFAIHGQNFDGHAFIREALAKGAAGVVAEQALGNDIPALQVADTSRALGQLSALHRGQLNKFVFGLTGSAGKTTTKAMLAQILRQKHQVLAPQASMNNAIGLPLTLLDMQPQHDYAVLEMGTNHFGEIDYLTRIARPDMALIINIGPAHLEFLESLDGVARAKAEIFSGLGPRGTALLNRDDAYFDYLRGKVGNKNFHTFGLSREADVRAEHIVLNEEGKARFDLILPQQTLAIQLNILGAHNVVNALAAATCAYFAGLEAEDIRQGLEKTDPVKMRLNLREGVKGVTIIDDSYSAIPNAVQVALQVLAERKTRKVFVFGGMAELEPQTARQLHRQIGEQAKALGVDYLFAINPLARETVQAFGAGAHYFDSKQELLTALQDILNPEMTILVKGSRGARMEEIVAALLKQ